MSKYLKLWEYVNNSKKDKLELTFDEINKILGFEIDHSFLNYKKELLEYRYCVKIIHVKTKSIEFIKSN